MLHVNLIVLHVYSQIWYAYISIASGIVVTCSTLILKVVHVGKILVVQP